MKRIVTAQNGLVPKFLREKRFNYPMDFPLDSLVNFEEAKNEIQKWAFEFNFGGGMFKLILGSFKKAISAKTNMFAFKTNQS